MSFSVPLKEVLKRNLPTNTFCIVFPKTLAATDKYALPSNNVALINFIPSKMTLTYTTNKKLSLCFNGGFSQYLTLSQNGEAPFTTESNSQKSTQFFFGRQFGSFLYQDEREWFWYTTDAQKLFQVRSQDNPNESLLQLEQPNAYENSVIYLQIIDITKNAQLTDNFITSEEQMYSPIVTIIGDSIYYSTDPNDWTCPQIRDLQKNNPDLFDKLNLSLYKGNCQPLFWSCLGGKCTQSPDCTNADLNSGYCFKTQDECNQALSGGKCRTYSCKADGPKEDNSCAVSDLKNGKCYLDPNKCQQVLGGKDNKSTKYISYISCYTPTGKCTIDNSCTEEDGQRCFLQSKQEQCDSECAKQFYGWQSTTSPGKCVIDQSCKTEDNLLCFRQRNECESTYNRLFRETNPRNVYTNTNKSACSILIAIACILGLISVCIMAEFKSSKK